MKHLKLYENFLFELKKYQSGKINILTDISQLPKVGVPADKSKFERDGIVAIDWDNIVCVRSSNELPTISGKNLVCHTGRALKTVGFNKSFEDYLKKLYKEKDEPDNEYLRKDPNYKDFETFKNHMLAEHGARWTKHFTLNHVVSSHSGGSWAGNKYIYLTPGKEMIKVNSTPVSLYAIDTYWDKSIVLTDNTVILFDPSAKAEVEDFIKSVKETRNLIYFLEVGDKKIDIRGEKLDADAAIEAMGYSVFSGGTHYSVQQYLDDEIRDLKDKEGIKMSGLHWGQKYEQFEKYGGGGDDWIFAYGPMISYEDYYNFNDKIIKREEKEYQAHRGFMKEFLESFKKQSLINDLEKIMVNTTKIARAICTPKYAYFERDKGNGMAYDDGLVKRIDLANWDIKNLETQLKPKEEESLLQSAPGRLKKELPYIYGNCYYVYFNKYLLNDLKIILNNTPFYKALNENKKELNRLSELVERESNLTDEEANEAENLMKLPKFEEFYNYLEKINSDLVSTAPGFEDDIDMGRFAQIKSTNKSGLTLPLDVITYFKNLNEGAKKYGFKDLFDMFSIK